MSRLRQAIVGALLLTISVLVALGGIELLLRHNLIPNEYYQRNRVLGDSHDGPILFILGDSFMVPMSGSDVVDYLYPLLAPTGFRIRNTATSGTGPVAYLENLRREGPVWRPRVVLLSYYVGNDLLDVGCTQDVNQRIRPPRPIPAWKRTYTAQYLKERMVMIRPGYVLFQSIFPDPIGWLAAITTAQQVDYEAMKRVGIPPADIDSARAGKLNPWIVSLGATYPDYYRDELLIRSDCGRRAWDNTRQVLDLILQEAANLHADVLPVIFPHTFQVSTAHYALYRSWKINVDDEMLLTHRPQDLLTSYFRSHGIEPIDLLDPFRSAGKKLYWDRDEHMNPQGQQLAAKIIGDALLARYGRKAPSPR